jgi:hypothetical protein
MRIRAQSIGLMPEIQDSCIDDLATCKNPEVKGEVRELRFSTISLNTDNQSVYHWFQAFRKQ